MLNLVGSDAARINSLPVGIYGVQPNVFNIAISDFLDVQYRTESTLNVSDQLYSAKGSQSVAVGSYVTDFINIDPTELEDTLLLQTYTSAQNKTNRYYRKRILWTAKQAPAFTMRDRKNNAHNPTVLVSLPVYNRMIDPAMTLNKTTWERVIIKLKDPENKVHIKKIIADAKAVFTPEQANGIRIFNYFDDTDTMDEVTDILDTIFNIIICITMFLCFFSLCSSMSANLLDQSKEIGILRAMGFTRTRIKLLYFYEAFVLVMASCMLGVMIGVIVGFTMVLQ